MATARLEVTGSADPALLVRAPAWPATGRTSLRSSGSARAASVDGMTRRGRSARGRGPARARLLRRGRRGAHRGRGVAAGDDELLVPLAEMRARNLMWGLFRHDEPRGEPRRPPPAGGPGRAAELVLNEAMLLTYSGRPATPSRSSPRSVSSSAPRHRALRALAEVPALIATGRCETAARAGRHARSPSRCAARADRHPRAGHPDPQPDVRPRRVRPARGGDGARGRGVRGDAGQRTARRADVAHPAEGPLRAAGGPARDGPHVGSAEAGPRAKTTTSSDRAGSCCPRWPPRRPASATPTRPLRLVVELERLPAFPFTRAEQELGRAWALVAAGDLAAGRMVLRRAADRAPGNGYPTRRPGSSTTCVRLGDPGDRGGSPRGAGRRGVRASSSPRTPHHAEAAVAGGDAEALTEAADASSGSARCSSRPRRRPTPPRRSSGAVTVGRGRALGGPRVAAGRDVRGGPDTPVSSNPVMVVPLTSRERDIAAARRPGRLEQGHRRAAVPVGADGEQPPPERLLEARRGRPA